MSLPNIELQQALQHHQNGNFAEAEKAYLAIIEKNQDASIYPNLVDVYNQQGKFGEAIDLLMNTIERSPNDPQLRMILSQTHLHIGQPAIALKIMLEQTERFPNMGESFYVLGNVYLQQGKVEDAYQSFEKAVQLLPQLAEGHYNLGLIQYQKGEFEKAEKLWHKSLECSPGLIHARMNLANMAIEQSKYDKAMEELNFVLKDDPEHFSAIKLMGMAYHASNQPDEALGWFLKIHSEEKPNEEIVTLIANVYRDLERVIESEKFYRKALEINPENKIAQTNIDKFNSRKISGWHFNMLGDLRRNEGYNEAIDRVVKKGDTVLDIGTGSGLLSLMCARAGAGHVYSCETIEPIAASAIEIVKDNGYSDKITVYHAKSNKLKVGREMPEKADVLVSEILDAGLLGEGVLPSLRHAQANLLTENAKIIPAAATVKGVLIDSEHLKSISPIKNISGFDLSGFGRFQTSEEYRQATLKSIPHKKLTEETSLLSVDFYKLPPQAANESPNKKTIEIEIVKDGKVDSIAFWFDLHLDDKLSLSSGPDGEMIHWGQAVYSFENSVVVKKGDILKVIVLQSETKILFSLAQ